MIRNNRIIVLGVGNTINKSISISSVLLNQIAEKMRIKFMFGISLGSTNGCHKINFPGVKKKDAGLDINICPIVLYQ
jgi:hypothetical protein